MAVHVSDDGPATDIARLIQSGGLVLIVTQDNCDQRNAAVRAAATQVARTFAANVLLFYVLPDEGLGHVRPPRLFDPQAREDTGARSDLGVARLHTGTRRSDLLSDEAAEIRSKGPQVRVWLSRRAGPAGIAEAVVATGAGIVFVPADPERTGVRARAIRLTLSYQAVRIPVPLVAVDANGRMAIVAPLGPVRPVAW